MVKVKHKKITSRKNIKRNILLVSIFIMLVITVSLFVSYSYYTKNESNLIYKGVASTSLADIDLRIYIEDVDASGNGLGTYSTRVFYIPEYGYEYNSSLTTCSNGASISPVYDGFELTASKKGVCKVYYDHIDGITNDILTNIYVSTDGSTFSPAAKVPIDGYVYELSTENTSCTNGATASISSNEILVTTSNTTVCNIYIKRTTNKTAVQTFIDLGGSSNADDAWEVRENYGYRYANYDLGYSAINYVSFNNQTWRIIGAINTEYDSNNDGVVDTSGYLLKIAYIPNDSEDLKMAVDDETEDYDTDISFEQTKLGYYLNNNLLKSDDYDYYSKLANVSWKIATFETTDLEDVSEVTNADLVAKEQAATETFIAKVALPNVTDYLYSIYQGELNDENIFTLNYLSLFNYGYMDTGTKSYLISDMFLFGYEHSIVLGKVSGGNYLSLYDPCYLAYYEESYITPTAYLKPGIYFTSGNGTSSNPYILSD